MPHKQNVEKSHEKKIHELTNLSAVPGKHNNSNVPTQSFSCSNRIFLSLMPRIQKYLESVIVLRSVVKMSKMRTTSELSKAPLSFQ